MFRIVVIGEKEVIIGFRGIGAELINFDSVEKVSDILERLANDKTITLIIITETVARYIMEKINTIREISSSIVLLIPTHTESLKLSLKEMRHVIEKAAGIDLLK